MATIGLSRVGEALPCQRARNSTRPSSAPSEPGGLVSCRSRVRTASTAVSSPEGPMLNRSMMSAKADAMAWRLQAGMVKEAWFGPIGGHLQLSQDDSDPGAGQRIRQDNFREPPPARPDRDIAADLVMALRFFSRLPTGARPFEPPDLGRIAVALPFASVIIAIGPALLLLLL